MEMRCVLLQLGNKKGCLTSYGWSPSAAAKLYPKPKVSELLHYQTGIRVEWEWVVSMLQSENSEGKTLSRFSEQWNGLTAVGSYHESSCRSTLPLALHLLLLAHLHRWQHKRFALVSFFHTPTFTYAWMGATTCQNFSLLKLGRAKHLCVGYCIDAVRMCTLVLSE